MWALKRKLLVIITLIFLISFIILISYINFFYKPPTCFDGIQNGNEEGVDCGGTCEEICRLKAERVNIFWSKTFKYSKDYSHIASLVENPNINYKIVAVYNIKTFDNKGIRINDFDKKITLEPAEKRLIFIPFVETGGSEIVQTFMDTKKILSLTKAPKKKNDISVVSKILKIEEDQSILTIGLKNKSFQKIENIEISTVLSTPKGEIVEIGRTFLEEINKESEEKIVITWPKKLKKNLIIDVYIRTNIE